MAGPTGPVGCSTAGRAYDGPAAAGEGCRAGHYTAQTMALQERAGAYRTRYENFCLGKRKLEEETPKDSDRWKELFGLGPELGHGEYLLNVECLEQKVEKQKEYARKNYPWMTEREIESDYPLPKPLERLSYWESAKEEDRFDLSLDEGVVYIADRRSLKYSTLDEFCPKVQGQTDKLKSDEKEGLKKGFGGQIDFVAYSLDRHVPQDGEDVYGLAVKMVVRTKNRKYYYCNWFDKDHMRTSKLLNLRKLKFFEFDGERLQHSFPAFQRAMQFQEIREGIEKYFK